MIVKPAVVERQRNAIVGEAEVRRDRLRVGADQHAHRVPLVVEQHLRMELPQSQPRAGDEREHGEREPRPRATIAQRHRQNAFLARDARGRIQHARVSDSAPDLRRSDASGEKRRGLASFHFHKR